MIIILGDLLADYSLRVPIISSHPKDLHEVSYLELGPGGATNVAIMAARFGLEVGCMGEVGDDLFGQVVIDGLNREGIDTSNIVVTAGARTPVANVLVDDRGEPAYLGYPGSLELEHVPATWHQSLQQAEALFVDGWAEHGGAPGLILESIDLARTAGVPIFFDPGPGNPRVDNSWHREALATATVLMATEEEAIRLTGEPNPVDSARALLELGPQLVIVKRGPVGCLLLTESSLKIMVGFPVTLRDTTGAGDGFAGAVIYGYLRGLDLASLGDLANATGAAKVAKLGTGHNMPTIEEINVILERFDRGSVRLGYPNRGTA